MEDDNMKKKTKQVSYSKPIVINSVVFQFLLLVDEFSIGL